MMHRSLASAVLLLLVLVPTVASAAPNALDLMGAGSISDDGQRVTVRLSASCPSGWDVLEANVSVSQEGASGLGGFGLTCTGHRVSAEATVVSFGGPYEPGPANASSFILLIDPVSGQTMSLSTSEVIRLH
jgi:hypothetical protein